MTKRSGSKDVARSVSLPTVPFLYTLDQVAMILNISDRNLKANYLYYIGRTPGPKSLNRIEAMNITPDNNQQPDWRVSERELVRWLARKGFAIERP